MINQLAPSNGPSCDAKQPSLWRYIIIGDTAVGKSCLLLQFTERLRRGECAMASVRKVDQQRGTSKRSQNYGCVELVVPFPSFSLFLLVLVGGEFERIFASAKRNIHFAGFSDGNKNIKNDMPMQLSSTVPHSNCNQQLGKIRILTRREESLKTLVRWGRDNLGQPGTTRRTTRSNKRIRHAEVEE